MDGRLVAATEIDGRQRFYPPGSHPATYRYRQHLEQLRAAGFDSRHEIVRDVESRIVAFEERESELKQEYLRVVERR